MVQVPTLLVQVPKKWSTKPNLQNAEENLYCCCFGGERAVPEGPFLDATETASLTENKEEMNKKHEVRV
jgi:hypothetical protein